MTDPRTLSAAREERGDAFAIYESGKGVWTIGNAGIVWQMGLDEAGSLMLLSLHNPRTGREWLPGPRRVLPPVWPAGVGAGAGAHFAFGTCTVDAQEGGVHVAVTLHSDETGLDATLHLLCQPNASVFSTWWVIDNGSGVPCTIQQLDSLDLQFDHHSTPLWLYAMRGGRFDQNYPPDGFALRRYELGEGFKKAGHVEISCGTEGRSSAQEMPWFALTAGDEGLFGGLEWSGRWRIVMDVREEAALRAGMTEVVHTMAPGERFEGARAFVGSFEGGLDEAGHALHAWALRYLCPPAPEGFPWIQYNQWFAYLHNFTEADMRREAELAARLGCEVFVVDAGWWRGCVGPHFGYGLGDWVEDTTKFPGGFRAFGDYVRSLGMRFGFWVEPERLHLDTAIAKEHPEWLVRVSGEKPHVKRSGTAQLCFGCPEVQTWVKDWLFRVIDAYQPDWVKWDHNISYGNGCCRPDHGHQEGDGTYAYTQGLYNVLDALRVRYPNMILENCASGGNRIDYGILRRTHTQWLSDYSHRADSVRFHLQGAWYALPTRYLNTWAMTENTTQTEMRSLLGGAWGFSAFLTRWSTDVLATAEQTVEEGKALRRLVLGKRYLLSAGGVFNSGGWDVWQFVDPAQGDAAVLYYRGKSPLPGVIASLKGLDPEVTYTVRETGATEGREVSGRALLEEGLRLTLPAEGSGIVWVTPKP
ncbi:MAG: alpha-galactosidase [Anaerolineae bacterium]